eukprot:scaffold17766_cov54-Attheya_sp.AAC.1
MMTVLFTVCFLGLFVSEQQQQQHQLLRAETSFIAYLGDTEKNEYRIIPVLGYGSLVPYHDDFGSRSRNGTGVYYVCRDDTSWKNRCDSARIARSEWCLELEPWRCERTSVSLQRKDIDHRDASVLPLQ